MKIYSEMSLCDFKAWCGAIDTLDRVIEEGKCSELEAILEDMYPDGIDDGTLNDILRFDSETVFEWLGISDEEDDEYEYEYEYDADEEDEY